MVLPDGTRSEPRRPASRRSVGIIALLALVAGTVAIGMLTTPEPEPETVVAPTTTTVEELERPLDLENFSIDQIATGEPLEWEFAAGIDSVFAHQVVLHEGVLYLFGTFQEWWLPGPHATVVWRSEDGRSWESLGTVLETESPLSRIMSTPQGLLGIVGGESEFTVWRSHDGARWEAEVVEVGEALPYSTINAGAVAANGETMVVTMNRQTDWTELFRERLRAAGADFDLSQLGWGQTDIDGEMRLVVTGPLGIHLMELTREETGLFGEQLDAAIMGGRETEPSLWVGQVGHEWQRRTIPGAYWIESLAFDGQRLVAIGDSRAGRSTWESDDEGLSWTEIGMTTGLPYNVTRWGERYVGLELGSSFDIRVSADGSTWESMDIGDHFPGLFNWSAWDLTAGEGGMAFIAEGNQYLVDAEPSEPSVLTGDGVTLRVNFSSGDIELLTDDETFTWGMWKMQPQDGIEPDLESGQIHFHHPRTGERLASFGIDELQEVEQAAWQAPTVGEYFQALVFTPDGESWTIQDLEKDFGEGTRAFSVTMTDNEVVALVHSWNNVDESEPGFEIWTAPIP